MQSHMVHTSLSVPKNDKNNSQGENTGTAWKGVGGAVGGKHHKRLKHGKWHPYFQHMLRSTEEAA